MMLLIGFIYVLGLRVTLLNKVILQLFPYLQAFKHSLPQWFSFMWWMWWEEGKFT